MKPDIIRELVLRKKDNIIYVDLVLYSMVRAVEDWYSKNYQNDPHKFMRKAHTFHLISFYDRNRFNNYKTLGKEREKFLEEVDLYVQMRRDD